MTRFPDFLGATGPADDSGTDPIVPAGLPVEPADSAIKRLEDELAELQDRHVRLAAEFDNYRKRSIRAVSSDPATTPVDALRHAINAVDQKVWKELQASGLERIDPVGSPFDPMTQEAVGIVPPPSPELEQTVAATFQTGYRFKGVLVRPARVQVFSGQGNA